MAEIRGALLEPLNQAVAPRSIREKAAIVIPFLTLGLICGACVNTMVGPLGHTTTVPTALASMSPARAVRSRTLAVPQAKPLQSFHPMTTVYSFEPATTSQWRLPARVGQSVQARASVQQPVVQATGESAGGLPWVVMKFGGSSVSTKERWEVITTQMKKVRETGDRPFVAISALGSVTNRLGRCIEEALEQDMAPSTEGSSYKFIYDAHMKLADELGVKSDPGMKTLMDLLEELEKVIDGIRLTREVSPRLRARISSFGELMSTALGVLVINKAGIPCVRLDARKLLTSTETPTQLDEDRYMQAIVNPTLDTELVASELQAASADMSMDPKKATAVLVQGFIGSTPKGDTCLLGRGGSDTSGALFAALVGAKKYEIWTDVHGLFTSDPRFVDGTRLIKSTNYRTAQELATLGAKVLHERCLVPAAWAGIPVEVHNTADPDGPMSRIESGVKDGARLLGVAVRKGQVLLSIKTANSLWGEPGFLAKVFAPFGELGVATDLVAVSQYTVSVALDYIPGGVDGDAFVRLYTQLSALGTIDMKQDMAVVSIVGENLREALPELGAAMEELKKRKVYLMSQSSEDLSMSFVVEEEDAPAVVQGLHNILLCGEPGKDTCAVDPDVFGQSWDELKTEFLKVEAR